MAETLKAAVIGAGYMGSNHARVYAGIDNVRLVAIADVRAEAEKAAKRYGAKFYTDYNAMLKAEKPDIVSIAVPTDLHLQVASDSAQAGANLLVEKPIAKTAAEGRELLKVAASAGVAVMVGHTERYNPAVFELKKHLVKKTLGKIYKVEVRRCGPFPERISDVGVAIDLAVHDIDVINYLLNRPKISRIHAEVEQRIHKTHEDLLTALIKFKDSSIAVLNIDWLTPVKERQISITGERGRFLVNYLTQDLYFYENALVPDRFRYAGTSFGVVEGNMTKYLVQKREPLQLEIEAFVNAVRGKPEGVMPAEDAIAALEIAERILEAAGRK